MIVNWHQAADLLLHNGKQVAEGELIKIPLDAVTLNPDSIFRLNDHELIYQKRLYDVVSIATEDGIPYYYCSNDSREEKMLEQISECTASQLDYYHPTNPVSSSLLKIFTQENSSSCDQEKKIPEIDFVFIFERPVKSEPVFLSQRYSPPERCFS